MREPARKKDKSRCSTIEQKARKGDAGLDYKDASRRDKSFDKKRRRKRQMKNLLVYLDNGLFFSNSVKEHLRRVGEIIGFLESAHVSLKLSKCEFFLNYSHTPWSEKSTRVRVRLAVKWEDESIVAAKRTKKK